MKMTWPNYSNNLSVSNVVYYAVLVSIVAVCLVPCFCCCWFGWLCSRCCKEGNDYPIRPTGGAVTTSATSTTVLTYPSSQPAISSSYYYNPEPAYSDIPEAVVVAVLPVPSAPPLPSSFK
mmetsp:Transcript_18143/g.25827  ORF Transcript_18143/g.25827 Transcript_18143/m.25827 type:complete len:120 (-) Transcript_18143:402-761(-)